MGGLAFEDLEKLNLAMLTKLAWMLCNEPDNLMTKVLSINYFKSGDIIHQNITAKNCSYTWNGITKGLQVVQHNFFMEINNGLKTKIWKDIWIPGLDHPAFPINDLFRFYEMVAELFILETSQWNVVLLEKLFDQDTSLKIQSLFIDINKEDTMLSTSSTDGIFSVKSTYKKLSFDDREVVIIGTAINKKVWKNLWLSKTAHRFKLFAWKCIRNLHCTNSKRAVYDIDEVSTRK